MLKIGITGPSGCGKSTIFTALTGKVATYTKEPDVAVINIPDERLDFLAGMFQREKKVYETLEFIDTKDNRNLLKNTDILVLIVPFLGNFKDPESYLEEMEEEFIIEDALLCEERYKRIEKSRKEDFEGELELLKKLNAWLEIGNPLRSIELKSYESKRVRGFAFLSIKQCVGILNIEEQKIGQTIDIPSVHSIPLITVCGELEMEVIQTGDGEEMRKEFGLGPPLIKMVSRELYKAQKLITFYTVVGKEARAWNIKEGETAIEAAKMIHSDIARGFIKGQVVSFDDLMEAGSFNEAKHLGKVRLEGKEHKINDGDVIEFRFNV